MKRFAAVLTTLTLTLVAADAFSQDVTPEQRQADYRHEVFESLGKHMKATSMMVKGEVPMRQQDLIAHSTAMNEISKTIVGMFPEGTGPDKVKTDALPSVWGNRGGFEAKAKALQDESAKLVAKAKAGDMDGFKGQFRAVGGSCGGCHDDFRKDE